MTPNRWALYANAPNPFNASTEIRFDVPSEAGDVTLRVYDVSGRLIRTLVDGFAAPGARRVTWDGRDDRGRAVASGVYFYRLSGRGFDATRKMVLAK